MLYHRKLRKYETLDLSGFDIQVYQLFLGKCHGMLLYSGEDRHIMCMMLVTEDGRRWEVRDGGFSSCWMTDAIRVVGGARNWILKHAVRDPKGGWKFRSKKRRS